MARLTPYALEQTRLDPRTTDTPGTLFADQTPQSVDIATMRRRVARIRREERWAEDRVMRETRRLMTGRYGVRI